MKTVKYKLGIFLAFLSLGCAKEYHVEEPTLQITVAKSTVKVGDVVVFNFDGNADFISFYSGEKGMDYAFHNKERIYQSNNVLSFRSAKYAGNNTDCARLKYSTDFNGVYDRAAIRAATWIDITDQFTIPPIVGTSATFSNSGDVEISNLFPADGKPVYFGWFFTTQANSQRTQFQVAEFKIQGVVTQDPSLSGVVYDFVDCAFKLVLGEGFDGVTVSPVPNVNSTRILWSGTFANDTFKEGWAISAPLHKSEQVNLGLDKPNPIKIVSDPESASYQYVYKTAGKYIATFVVANSSVYGRKEVVKQIEINVEP